MTNVLAFLPIFENALTQENAVLSDANLCQTPELAFYNRKVTIFGAASTATGAADKKRLQLKASTCANVSAMLAIFGNAQVSWGAKMSGFHHACAQK